MKLISYLLGLLLCFGQSAADTFNPEYFLNGTIDLASAFRERGLPQGNAMRRGDSPFDNLKVTLYGDVVVHPRLQILNQIILAPSSRASPASFLRTYIRFQVKEDQDRSLPLEVGKISTPFGGYGGRAHSDQNPLISAPLMFHYFTTLRANQLPTSNADLIGHRGEGASADFTEYGEADSGSNGMP